MTYHDEFDDLPRGGPGFLATVGPKAAFFTVLIALSFMIGVVWKLYTGANDGNEQNVPVVRADNEPFKVVPDDPGGMEIPHKDSTIFSTLKSDREEESVRIENLLADDENEEPMPRSQLFAGLNTEQNPDIDAPPQDSPLDKPVSKDAQQIGQPVEEAEKESQKVVESTPEPAPAVPEKVEPVVEIKPGQKLEPKPAPKPEPVKETPAPVSGDYYVQVGSVKSAEGAEGEWTKFVKKYSVLSAMAHRVERADLGEKGIFYRIQAGPVSKDKAVSVCGEIKKITPGGCLVKKK